jgi:hypothetical protein
MKIKSFKHEDIRRESDEIMEARECKITYQELFDASEIFEEDPSSSSDAWVRTRRFVDWENLHNLQTKEVRRRIIGFLNEWHCRLPSSDKLAEKIKEAYRSTFPFLKALEGETLQDFQFEKRKEVEGKEYSNEEILDKIFSSFCRIGDNFRGVATSKFLSLINPHLFVMWDTPICEAYGIKSPSNPYARDKQYVPEFFPLMKRKVNDAIASYMKEKKCSRSEAIRAINRVRKWRPLAKLLDEYNWVTYSQK